MPTERKYITCIRKQSLSIYGGSGWHCSRCNYTPGTSQGPPNDICYNCKANLYTDTEQDATAEIEIFEENGLCHFRLIREVINVKDAQA